MKIAYFGFDLFYDCLQMLIESGHEILKIFTCDVDGNYEQNVRTYAAAKKYGIEITKEKPTADMLYELYERGCRLTVSAGYYFKIPVVQPLMQVNIHPSLLPQGRGPWPQPVAILKGLDTFGVTLHKLSASLDSGDILLFDEFGIADDENLETLTLKTQLSAPVLLRRFLKKPEYFWQNSVRQCGGEYWPEPSKDEMTFDVSDSFDKIDKITRAFYGYVCYMKKDGKTIAVKAAKCLKNDRAESLCPLMIADINGGVLAVLNLA